MNHNAKNPVFLRAAWHYLIMANYVVDPEVLTPWLPAGTEIDFFEDKAYASVVGFRFLDTRVLGVAIPFHQNFTEVNLRFYVRRKTSDGQWRRGTVFVSELVPKPAVALMANSLYREQYAYARMRHTIEYRNNELRVYYRWKKYGQWHHLYAKTGKQAQDMTTGSIEEFIAEHYWGYNRFSEQYTMEYAVEHPRWQFYPVLNFGVKADVAKLYGKAFEPYLQQAESVFLLHGSDVLIRQGNKLKSKNF